MSEQVAVWTPFPRLGGERGTVACDPPWILLPPCPGSPATPSPQGSWASRFRWGSGVGTTEPQREPGGRGGRRALPVTTSHGQKNTKQFVQI